MSRTLLAAALILGSTVGASGQPALEMFREADPAAGWAKQYACSASRPCCHIQLGIGPETGGQYEGLDHDVLLRRLKSSHRRVTVSRSEVTQGRGGNVIGYFEGRFVYNGMTCWFFSWATSRHGVVREVFSTGYLPSRHIRPSSSPSDLRRMWRVAGMIARPWLIENRALIAQTPIGSAVVQSRGPLTTRAIIEALMPMGPDETMDFIVRAIFDHGPLDAARVAEIAERGYPDHLGVREARTLALHRLNWEGLRPDDPYPQPRHDTSLDRLRLKYLRSRPGSRSRPVFPPRRPTAIGGGGQAE